MTTENLRIWLSQNIKRNRKKLKITQEILAEKADLSVQMINDIEGCRSWVSDRSLVKIAIVLKTTPAELLLPPSTVREADFSMEFLLLSELKFELQNQIGNTIDKMLSTLKNA